MTRSSGGASFLRRRAAECFVESEGCAELHAASLSTPPRVELCLSSLTIECGLLVVECELYAP